MITHRLAWAARRIPTRAFSTVETPPAGPKFSAKRVALNVGTLAVAMGAGSLLYDFLSSRNLQKISDTIDQELSWDDEWDRYVRVPTEVHDDIKEWFVPPDAEIVKAREAYDEANEIGLRDMILVRHGQYITTGDRVGELTPLGEEQAVKTGERLRELLKGRTVRCIYHSDMIRAKQTARLIAKSFPGIELRSTLLLAEAIPAVPDPVSASCPPFIPEEGVRLEKAFRSFFARPIGEGTNESVDILVGHGNCFRFFVCRAMQIDPRFWLRMAIYNCGISWIELDMSGKVSVRNVGDVGHLPVDKISYS